MKLRKNKDQQIAQFIDGLHDIVKSKIVFDIFLFFFKMLAIRLKRWIQFLIRRRKRK